MGKKEDFYEMKLRTRGISGTRNQAESERERAHRVIARKAAAEGIVLLENNGVLPLKKGSKVALYGGGARHTIKGGTGSGSVNNRSNVSTTKACEMPALPSQPIHGLTHTMPRTGKAIRNGKIISMKFPSRVISIPSTVHMPAIRCRCQRAAPLQKRRRQTPST